MDRQGEDGMRDAGVGKQGDGKSRATQAAKAVGAFLLLLAGRLWAGLVRGWQELGRRDAADIAAARAHAEAPRRRGISTWLPKRRSAVVALSLLLLLALWRCGHDGVPTGSRGGIAGNAGKAAGNAGTTACNGLLEHDTWVGTIAYAHKRDVTDADGEHRLSYEYEIDVSAEMTEKTRRKNRQGKDYLVEVFSPRPEGRVKAEQIEQIFDHRGLSGSSKFLPGKELQQYEKGMGETGSMMSLTVRDDCSYRFYLQAQVMGEWESHDRSRGTSTGEGMLGIPSMHGDGIADNGSRLSGSADYPLRSSRHLDETRSRGWQNFVAEREMVEDILGRENLGTVTVTWNFEARD